MKRKRKIRGRFCEGIKAPRGEFDRRSFRWVRSGKAWLLIGCPIGRWKRGRCAVGTRAHVILKPSRGRCGRGQRSITK